MPNTSTVPYNFVSKLIIYFKTKPPSLKMNISTLIVPKLNTN